MPEYYALHNVGCCSFAVVRQRQHKDKKRAWVETMEAIVEAINDDYGINLTTVDVQLDLDYCTRGRIVPLIIHYTKDDEKYRDAINITRTWLY